MGRERWGLIRIHQKQYRSAKSQESMTREEAKPPVVTAYNSYYSGDWSKNGWDHKKKKSEVGEKAKLGQPKKTLGGVMTKILIRRGQLRTSSWKGKMVSFGRRGWGGGG